MKTITKHFWVRIKQITADGTGVLYGLGSDGRAYVWHHSFEYRGKWVLYINFNPRKEDELSKRATKK